MQQNWVGIFGRIEYRDGEIRHLPVSVPTQPGGPTPPEAPHSLARSNLAFAQGTVSFEALLLEPDARCQIGFPGPEGAEVFAGLNSLGTPYGIGVFRNGQWEGGGGAGFGDKPRIDQWIEVSVNVVGSSVSLSIDGVKVLSANHRIVPGQLSLLMQSSQEVRVRSVKAKTNAPVCFVVMQFTEAFNELYREVIKPSCEHFGYAVVRADDFYTSGLILDDITRSIRESALVIADVTPDNPNVFYEVGYAHGIGKPTILLSDRKRDRLPFDISGFRTLFYDNTIGGKTAVESRLKKHLEGIGA